MTKGWTPERRAAQSARIRALKPWAKSTGPKTEAGKKRSCQNALKHGDRSEIVRQAKEAMRLHRDFMRLTIPQLNNPEWNDLLQKMQSNYTINPEKL